MFDRISTAAKAVVVGGFIVGGALTCAGQAFADPVLPVPAPGDPAAPPAPGQPVAVTGEPVGAQPAPPAGAPPVPGVTDQVYGQGQTPGQLGYLRDIWHTFHSANPLDELTMPPEEAPGAPAGAGPAPKLPPGFTSLTDPSSSTPALPAAAPGAPSGPMPKLPPGYVSYTDPSSSNPTAGTPGAEPAAAPAAPLPVDPAAPLPPTP